MLRHHLLLFSLLLACSCTLATKSKTSQGTATKVDKPKPKEMIELDDKNWTQTLTGNWFIAFYAPWCPACKDFLPEYKLFAQYNRGGEDFKVAAVDIQKYPGLSGRFLISALPSIYHIQDGIVRQYTGVRDRERMNRYLDMHGWDEVKPVSDWIHPNSAHMGFAGSFFELSMKMKDVHTWMVEDKGIPTWLTYVIFCVATISLGGLIGVVLVFVIERATGRGKSLPDQYVFNEGRIKPTKSRSSSIGSGTDSEGDKARDQKAGDLSDGDRTSSTTEGEDSGDQEEVKGTGGGGGDAAAARRRKVRRED